MASDELEVASTQRRTVPFYQVDAFTNRPYAGNSAAVCLLDNPDASSMDDETLQAMARENNLSGALCAECHIACAVGTELQWIWPLTDR